MPASSLSSLIVDLVASVETTVISLREHHLSGQAVHRLVREASAGQVADAPAGAPRLTGPCCLRQEGPEQAGREQRGVAIDQPVADRA